MAYPRYDDASVARRAFAVELNRQLAEQIKLLLEQKHLYQKISIDPEPLKAKILSESFGHLHNAIEQLAKHLLEAPLRPSTTERFATSAGDMRREEVELMLVVLNVRMYCTTCEERSLFEPIFLRDLGNELLTLARSGHEFPLRKLSTNQTFFVALQCQHCKGMPEAVLIRRDGWKFYLEGRSPMEHLDLPKYVPRVESHLLRDALIAWHAGKKLAAVFYLRCFIEQFARRQTGFLNEKKTGDEIMDACAQGLPEDKRSHLPSLKHWYDILSIPVHSADEELAERIFESAAPEIEHHFELRQAFRIPDNAPPKGP